MKPGPFAYASPESLEGVLELLRESGDEAKILAGGQSLVPLLNMRLAMPALLIDINRMQDQDNIELNGALSLGPLVRQSQLERWSGLNEHAPLISEAIQWVGHSQIRNRGTVLGSLAHADPAAELPVAFQALEAEMEIIGPNGRRTVPAINFFVHVMTTAIEPDEMLTSVRIPPWPDGTGTAFLEVARRHGDFAVASVAVVVIVNEGVITRARIALGGVGPIPLRPLKAEAELQGVSADSNFADIAAIAAGETEPVSDVHGSAEYRRDLVGSLVRRGLTTAVVRARHKIGSEL